MNLLPERNFCLWHPPASNCEDNMQNDELKALHESAAANKASYQFNEPDARLLEAFTVPAHYGKLTLDIIIPEFTSLCPITGQPDYATIKIKYSPREKCVESKSLKLYLMGYRNHGAFHEDCISRISSDLIQLLDPTQLLVIGEFASRGGISFQPTAAYYRP